MHKSVCCFFVAFRENGLAELDRGWGWLFVDEVPLLCGEKSVAKQLKVEEWLDLYQLTRELGIVKAECGSGLNSAINYVI